MKKKWMHGLAGALVVGAFAFVPHVALAAMGDVEINETNFPDAKFRNYISENFDQDGNGSLSSAEIANVKKISLGLINLWIDFLIQIQLLTIVTVKLCLTLGIMLLKTIGATQFHNKLQHGGVVVHKSSWKMVNLPNLV